jgi:hypothetical protein
MSLAAGDLTRMGSRPGGNYSEFREWAQGGGLHKHAIVQNPKWEIRKDTQTECDLCDGRVVNAGKIGL